MCVLRIYQLSSECTLLLFLIHKFQSLYMFCNITDFKRFVVACSPEDGLTPKSFGLYFKQLFSFIYP